MYSKSSYTKPISNKSLFIHTRRRSIASKYLWIISQNFYAKTTLEKIKKRNLNIFWFYFFLISLFFPASLFASAVGGVVKARNAPVCHSNSSRLHCTRYLPKHYICIIHKIININNPIRKKSEVKASSFELF